jgi:hypothetical protein
VENMSLTPIIISGIVCVLIGIAIGSMIASLLKDGKEKPAAPIPDEGEWLDLVTLVTDKEAKVSFPKFNGQVYQFEKELPDQQRQILLKALREMRTWLGEPEPVVPVPAAPVPAVPANPVEVVAPVVAPAIAEAEVLVPLAPPPAAKPSMNPIDLFAKAIQAEAKPVNSAPKSIVAQIDEILQKNLENAPLEKRGIRLVELPGKGMVVMVGLDQYGGVDEVPDAEIQQLIRSSAKEWEDRLELGGKTK